MKDEREYSFIENSYNKPFKVWDNGVPFEAGVYTQAEQALSLPFVSGVSLMPDAHIGMGSTVGSVIVTNGAVIPSAVGVDIGCGMQVRKLKLRVEDIIGRESHLYNLIIRAVPNGRSDNGGKNDIGRWHENVKAKSYFEDNFLRTYETIVSEKEYSHIGNYGSKVTWEHLGTLGTGNHFLELSADEDGQLYLVVHSGSRGLGARCGNVFMKIAKEECKKWFIDLVDPHLAYLPHGTKHYDYYLKALHLSQNFAKASRTMMLDNALLALNDGLGYVIEEDLEGSFDCHHNYASIENHNGKNVIVTRKGACRARNGDKAIIPGSMGARSYLVEGLENSDSFHSCSHGAGRKMSRTQALKEFTVEEHVKATEGVYCDKTVEVLDETPGAYKDIDCVINAQKTLVKPYAILKQLICVKGKESKGRGRGR